MSCQKTSAAHHHPHLESVSFCAFNNFITEQIRAAEIVRMSRTQKMTYRVFQIGISFYTVGHGDQLSFTIPDILADEIPR